MLVEAPVLRKAREPMVMTEINVDEPRAGEARVRMVATGVCHSCLSVANGNSTAPPMPIVLGDEGAGVVEAVGDEVTVPRVGDHVVISWLLNCGVCQACMAGRPTLCRERAKVGLMRDGSSRFHAHGDGEIVHHYGPATYAPQIIVPATSAIPIRRDLPFEKAALLGCSVTTGVGSVLFTAKMAFGQSVAVFGCGGIGLNAVQAARLAGGNPIIAVDVSQAALDLASRFGATHTVNASREDGAAMVGEITSGGVDIAVAAVGSAAVMEAALSSVAPGGALVIVGVPPTADSTARLDMRFLVGGERRVIGSTYGSANPAVDFPRFADLYMSGRLDLDTLVTERYTIDEANDAFEALTNGAAGRGIIAF